MSGPAATTALPAVDPPALSARAPDSARDRPPRLTLRIGGGVGIGEGGSVAGGGVAEADVWLLSWLGAGIEGVRAGNQGGSFYAANARLSFRAAVDPKLFFTTALALGAAKWETSDVRTIPCDEVCLGSSENVVSNTRRGSGLGGALEFGLHVQGRVVEGSALARVDVDGPVVTFIAGGAIGVGF
ncbi:MAG TPA: hypothetical protein VMI54_30840 [Polyangiaceae bacterium]|nr:hypothetical protein [Polyangiaceae bacterium]